MKGSVSRWPLEIIEPSELGFDPDRLKRIDQLIERFVAAGEISGGVTVVARHNGLAQLGVYGRADIEHDKPMRDDTLFRIYSMTKPITSVAALLLFEESRFLLDEPVKQYLPEFADVRVKVVRPDGTEALIPPRRDVTIHDLLTHLGGLSYQSAMEARRAGTPLAEFVRRYAQRPLVSHPGERWNYSAGVEVLARLIEVLSGLSLDAFFEERIFRPLNMTDTHFLVPPEKMDRLATLYAVDADGQLTPKEPEIAICPYTPPKPGETRFLSGGGGLVSSASDYLRFCLMLLNGGSWDGVRLLSRKTVELMTADHLPPGHPPIEPYKLGFGLGVSVLRRLGEKQGLGSVGEFGWGGIASTEAWVDPAEDLIAIVMFQVIPAARSNLTKLFKHAVYQAIAD